MKIFKVLLFFSIEAIRKVAVVVFLQLFQRFSTCVPAYSFLSRKSLPEAVVGAFSYAHERESRDANKNGENSFYSRYLLLDLD